MTTDPSRAPGWLPQSWPGRTFLGGLAEATRDELLASGTRHLYRAGETILMEGASGTDVVVLVDGAVKVTQRTDGWRWSFVAIRVGGDLVGEMAAMTGRPRTATVRAAGDVDALVVARTRFRSLLDRHPDATDAFHRMLASRITEATTRTSSFTSVPAGVRLARGLADLMERYGRPGTDGVVIDFELTQLELAALADARETTVQKHLRAWRRGGVLDTGYRVITVRDEDALRRAAEAPDAHDDE